MTKYRSNALALVLTLSGSVAALGETPSLCLPKEQKLFVCRLKKKLFSLCALRASAEKVTHVKYRAGKAGAVELELPNQEASPSKFFRSVPLPRGNSVTFQNADFEYTLTSSIEGRNEISVEKGQRTVASISCEPLQGDDADLTMNAVMTTLKLAGITPP